MRGNGTTRGDPVGFSGAGRRRGTTRVFETERRGEREGVVEGAMLWP